MILHLKYKPVVSEKAMHCRSNLCLNSRGRCVEKESIIICGIHTTYSVTMATEYDNLIEPVVIIKVYTHGQVNDIMLESRQMPGEKQLFYFDNMTMNKVYC